MFPHVPLQAITLDLADTRSISLTVEHILNNTIYIPDSSTGDTSTSVTTHTTTPSITPSPEAQAQLAPLTGMGWEEGAESRETGLRRRHRAERDSSTECDSEENSELITDNQSGISPCDDVVAATQEVGSGEDDPMTFSSLQRRKRELLVNAKR